MPTSPRFVLHMAAERERERERGGKNQVPHFLNVMVHLSTKTDSHFLLEIKVSKKKAQTQGITSPRLNTFLKNVEYVLSQRSL